jgi:antitoxin component YwqK of YwqJK toxin-antitoxin module
MNGNGWRRHHLKGRVLYAHSEVADLSHKSRQWVEEQRRPLSTVAFNENGLVVKELLYNVDGGLSQIGSIKYDALGNKRKLLFENPRGGLLSSLEFEYDESGKLLECVSTEAYSLISKQRCRPLYDPTGKKVEAIWFFEDGMPARKYVYRYRLTGELAQQLLYKYAGSGIIEEKWSTIYDQDGNILETACFDSQGRTIAGPTWYRYSDRGDEVEAATCDLKGDVYSTTSYSYDFDGQGNWIKRLEVFKTARSDFETRIITYRTLEYYSFSR